MNRLADVKVCTPAQYRYEKLTEVFADFFEAKSIQSAKAHLTKIANGQTLFSWVQSWDNETQEYTGKDLRWKPWDGPHEYTQKDGQEIRYSQKLSERVSGEALLNETDAPRYTRYMGYTVNVTLHWRKK